MPTAVSWRAVLGWIAIAFAVLEVVSVLAIDVPAAVGGGFAVLFIAGWYWLRRRGIGGIALVGVLCLLEVVAVPFYSRPTTLHLVLQVAAVVLGLAGVTAAVMAFRYRSPVSA
jgi:Cu/Ag efflux pump CusA